MMFDSFLPPPEMSTESDQDSVQLYTTVKDGKKKNFVCTAADCLKIFRFKSEIERHIFTHSQSRPFLCPFDGCARAFKRTNALQNHVRSQHTGEASLNCPYPDCNMSFTTTAKLRYHKALHLSEKPYKCSFEGCGRSFVTFSQLKQHEKSPSVHVKKEQFAETTSVYQHDVPFQSPVHDKEIPTKKIKAEPHPGRFSQPSQVSYSEKESPSYLYMQEPYPIQEPIMVKKNEEEFASIEGETQRLHNVLTENQILRKELESSESLINRIKGGLGNAALAMFDEIQKMVTNKYNSSFMKNNNYQEPSEKDVDSYFFENDCQNLNYLYEEPPFSAAPSCEETSVHSEQDMFGNYTCENLSTLLFGKHDRL